MKTVFKIPAQLREVGARFKAAGFSAYVVGGAVRDYFLRIKSADWDIATNAHPDAVQSIFSKTIPTGIAHGTVTILYKGLHIECTTFRADGSYSDGRRPDSVSYADTIEEDLSRRDFTVNALAADMTSGCIVDPFGGRTAIQQKIIQTVGSPDERFKEDGLRLLRAIRFACTLEFSIERKTLHALSRQKKMITTVSVERIRDEFIKMLGAVLPSRGFKLLEDAGLLTMILPELARCRSVEQGGLHSFDVLDHSLLACDAAPPDKLHIRLAALFHDIGKAATQKKKAGGGYSFYGHQHVSADLTQAIMTRLKFPHKITAQTVHLIKQHMFHYESSQSDAAIRRFIVRVGKEHIDDLFALRIADVYALSGKHVEPTLLSELSTRIDAMLTAESAFSIKDLAINGNDLIEAGIPKGRTIGIILRELFETVLDDPHENTRTRLLAIAKAFYKKIEG